MSAPNLSRVNGFQPGCVVPLSESRLAFAAGKLVVEMDLESKAQRPGIVEVCKDPGDILAPLCRASS